MFARHRKQLCAMAQGAKSGGIRVGRTKWEVGQPPSASRDTLIQAKFLQLFRRPWVSLPAAKKGLQPPAIINY
jgi:hypothetical protein